jgi:hypothetical protein
VLGLASPAHAHHPSGVSSTGAGPIVAISASTLEREHGAAAVFFELIKMDPFSGGSHVNGVQDGPWRHLLIGVAVSF